MGRGAAHSSSITRSNRSDTSDIALIIESREKKRRRVGKSLRVRKGEAGETAHKQKWLSHVTKFQMECSGEWSANK